MVAAHALLLTMRFRYNMNLIGLLAFVSLASAVPGGGRKTCVVKASGSNETDDAPAIRSAFLECGKRGKVVFEPVTYYVNSVLNVTGLDDVDIDIQGTLLVCPLPVFLRQHGSYYISS